MLKATVAKMTSTIVSAGTYSTHLLHCNNVMAGKDIVRDASHAGSWYTASPIQLSSQLEAWLAAVKTPISCIGPASEGQTVPDVPVPGARMIIAPYVLWKRQCKQCGSMLRWW